MHGEVDLLTIPVLQSALREALDRRPAHLVVDLAGVQFCSVRALTVLALAGSTATQHRIGYAVAGLPAHLNLLCDQVWPDQLPLPYPNTAAAVTALRANPG